MREISNVSLIILLIITVVASAVGTILNIYIIRNLAHDSEITGKLLYGGVNLTIEGITRIEVSSSEIDFGSGQISDTTDLSTEQANPSTFNRCIEFNGTYTSPTECRGIQLDNTGNTFMNVTLNFSKDGNSLFLGDNATDEFRFAIVEGNLSRNSSDSCKVNSHSGLSLFPAGSNYTSGFMNWTDVNQSFIYTICHKFSFSFGEKSLVLEVNLSVPADEGSFSPGQERSVTLIFTAEGVI